MRYISRLSPHKRTAMSAVAGHPHPLTQERCSGRFSYGMVLGDYGNAVVLHDRDELLAI